MFYRPENDEREQLIVYDKRSSAEDVSGLGWTVVIHLPTSQTSLFVHRINRGYAVLALASIVLVLGFGFWAGSF